MANLFERRWNSVKTDRNKFIEIRSGQQSIGEGEETGPVSTTLVSCENSKRAGRVQFIINLVVKDAPRMSLSLNRTILTIPANYSGQFLDCVVITD